MALHIKRAYEDVSQGDGYRVLVDRIWPRGVSREEVRIDEWLKEIAPSTQLRKWFGHDPEKWPEFEKKYRTEIHENKKAWQQLQDIYRDHPNLTLVYGAKDEAHNNAVVLQKLLKK